MPGWQFPCTRCAAELVIDDQRHVIRCTKCGYHAAEVLEPTGRKVMVEGAFCGICLDGIEGLVRDPGDESIDCERCRTEHPRSGRLSFDSDQSLGKVSKALAHARGWKHRKGG